MQEGEDKIDFSGGLMAVLQQAEEQGLDAESTERLYNEYFSYYTRKNAVPHHGMFELTPLCNLNCKMCYVHLTRDQLGERHLLPTETWIRLIDEAAQAGMMKATLTGGECLTYPGFDEIYLHLESLGIRMAVLTNGILLNEKRIEFFKEHPPAMIQVTLYGSNEDEYEQVCGVRQFETVLSHIKMVQAAELPLFIAITPNRFLPDAGEGLLRLVHSLGVPYNINSCLFSPQPGTGREHDSIDMAIDDYIHLYTLRAELNSRKIMPVDPLTLPEPAPESTETVLGVRCGAGMNSFTIQWDGTMVPCSTQFAIQGNPLTDGFSAVWRKIHEGVLRIPIPAECADCKYNSTCPSCTAIHAQDAPPGHASKRQCQRAKRLVECGLAQLIQS